MPERALNGLEICSVAIARQLNKITEAPREIKQNMRAVGALRSPSIQLGTSFVSASTADHQLTGDAAAA
jgi:hypothetical protein